MGVMAGPGVGKSVLLGMLARSAQADVVVVGLVGERGREVREFIERDLGAGLARSVVVVATSDESPLKRLRAAMSATAVAEHFRGQGPQGAAAHGLALPRGHGAARDRPRRRRAADHQGLPALRLRPAAPAGGARRQRRRPGEHHRLLHGPRRGRRQHRRPHRRRGPRHPRRPHRAGPEACRVGPLPRGRRAGLGLPRDERHRPPRPPRAGAGGARGALGLPRRRRPHRGGRLRRGLQPPRRPGHRLHRAPAPVPPPGARRAHAARRLRSRCWPGS